MLSANQGVRNLAPMYAKTKCLWPSTGGTLGVHRFVNHLQTIPAAQRPHVFGLGGPSCLRRFGEAPRTFVRNVQCQAGGFCTAITDVLNATVEGHIVDTDGDAALIDARSSKVDFGWRRPYIQTTRRLTRCFLGGSKRLPTSIKNLANLTSWTQGPSILGAGHWGLQHGRSQRMVLMFDLT